MYKQSIVLYIDILGFSEIVKMGKQKAIFKLLNNFGMPFHSTVLDNISYNAGKNISLDQVPKRMKELKKIDKEIENDIEVIDRANGKRKCTIFSDNILVSYEVDKVEEKERIIILYHEIERIIEIIKDLIMRNIKFRGGMVIGDLYHGDKIVFGPALVNAYEIESKYSIYPRICVDKNIITLTNNAEHCTKLMNCISEDFDGMYFIDYLKNELLSWYCINKRSKENNIRDINNQELEKLLLSHTEYIESSYEEAKDKEFYNKIAWQKNYHNRVIRKFGDKLKEYDFNINKYLIN